MLANLEGEDEMPPPPPGPNIINVPPPVRLSGSRATSEIPPIASVSVPAGVATGGKGVAAPPIATADEPFESALGLRELASLTVTNEAEALSYGVSVRDKSIKKFRLSRVEAYALLCYFILISRGHNPGLLAGTQVQFFCARHRYSNEAVEEEMGFNPLPPEFLDAFVFNTHFI